MNEFLIIILVLLVADYVLEVVVERLNLAAMRPDIPEDFRDLYDAEKYAKSQKYLRESTRFELLESSLMLPLTIGFLLLGGFAWADRIARQPGWGMIATGLLFAGSLGLLSTLVSLPFRIYDTFVLEARYGFNKTTVGTFIADLLKGLLLGGIIGGLVLAGILWFFASAGTWAWFYAWAALAVFQLVMLFLAPVVILPLFNKFTPLEDGELRTAIQQYADGQKVSLSGIFKIDGSRRSTKANAYFTGFGRTKRIALFDTLIARHPVPELVAVLAHEVGHYRLGHIRRMLVASLAGSLLMFWILGQFIAVPKLYAAFGVAFEPVGGHPPIYAGLIFFGFLYAPISMAISLLSNLLSRKHEFEADAFAAKTTGRPQDLVEALRKLTVDNLGNLTPHPLKVFLEYSHPPVLERIAALRSGETPR